MKLFFEKRACVVALAISSLALAAPQSSFKVNGSGVNDTCMALPYLLYVLFENNVVTIIVNL